eukprot:jgi/Mesen1/7468/ME000039S06687
MFALELILLVPPLQAGISVLNSTARGNRALNGDRQLKTAGCHALRLSCPCCQVTHLLGRWRNCTEQNKRGFGVQAINVKCRVSVAHSEQLLNTCSFRGDEEDRAHCLLLRKSLCRGRTRGPLRDVRAYSQVKRKIWPDAKPLVTGKVTRKALLLLKQIKQEELSDDELMERLQKWVKGMNPVRRDFLDVLKALDCYETMEVLYKVTEWSFGEDWFEANIRDYTKLVERYGKDGRLDDMERTLAEMDADGFPPDLVTFSVVIHAYGRAGHLAKAEQTFEELRLMGMQADAKCYTNLMVAYGLGGQPEKAEALLQEMELAQCPPNMVTYTVLINGYGRHKRPEDARRVFERMQVKSQIFPDGRCFTALMDAYAKVGDLEEARAIFQKMRVVGLTPDDMAVAMLVEACGMHGSYREAVQVVLEYEGMGQKPGVNTLSALIEVFGREGFVEEAEEVYTEMKQAGIEPIAKTYARLYYTYAKAGKMDRADAVQEEMLATGWEASAYCADMMLKGLLEGGRQEKALEMYDAASQRGLQFSDELREAVQRLLQRTA